MTVQIHEVRFHVMRMKTRFPFKYGIASMTALPHLFARVEAEVNRKSVAGVSSEGLPPKWFTKDPDTTFDEDLPDMLRVIRHAADLAVELRKCPACFSVIRRMYCAQMAWANGEGLPPLLAGMGSALIERAILDAFCRRQGKPFASLVESNILGIRLDAIHEELSGWAPGDFLTQDAPKQVIARHTVGLGDAFTSADSADDPGDGLPFTLEECIRQYGLTHFKIKVSGNLDTDRERLRAIAHLLQREAPGYRYTLDGNEQFKTPSDFSGFWGELCEEGALRDFLGPDHLIFIEQPIHRDHAFENPLTDWNGPPVIIDESDGELHSASKALELGYAGTSHKNCKGVVKGIANACLMRKREKILSGEDLANVGPVALLQDLAVMRTLGIEHVERNGHHYFRGLSMFPAPVREQILDLHPDLYHRHEAGFPTLTIQDGAIDLSGVAAAPFGVKFLFEPQDGEWVSGEELGKLVGGFQ